MHLQKNSLHVCLILLCSSEYLSAEDFLLTHFPLGLTCTVHMKYFDSDGLLPRDQFETVIISNKNSVLFTLWSNESLFVTPIIQFLEQCSVKILIEKLLLNTRTVRDFFTYTNYAGRGPLHSVYILLKWNCFSRFSSHIHFLHMEFSLFFHFLRICKDNPIPSQTFPSFTFIPVARIDGSGSAKLLSRLPSESILVKPTLLPPCSHPYKIDCVTAIGIKGGSISCFKNPHLQNCISPRQLLLGHFEVLLSAFCF
jgi:hypothetical protein